MNLQRKPRLGVLALMLEGLRAPVPGITRRQTDYVHALLEHLAPAGGVHLSRSGGERRGYGAAGGPLQRPRGRTAF